MGISISTASTSASGMMACTASVAACALDRDSAASRWTKRLWRTGLESDTRPESTKVMHRTPQPMRVRATLQPRVPAPRSRKRMAFSRSGSSSGSSRHFMSFTLRSTASAAMRFLSKKAVRSKFAIFDHPANCTSGFGAGTSSNWRATWHVSPEKTKTRERSGTSAPRLLRWGSRKARTRGTPPDLCLASAKRRLRNGHPGASLEEGSTNTAASRSSPRAAVDSSRSAASSRTSQGSPSAPFTRRKAPAMLSAASLRSRSERRQMSSRSKPASSAP
mmetsp:Transcript_1362/g.3293  ORF Transcript_1362/g.3293 Transcript_1362/m.3293 type:complete len:276 (+) Transcript_1362:732-1559(+)